MIKSSVEWEYRPGEEMVLRIRPPKCSIPDETREQLKTAGKELLLACRGFLDAAISHMDSGKKPETGRTQINIE